MTTGTAKLRVNPFLIPVLLEDVDLPGGGGGGIEEAPENGLAYARKNAEWASLQDLGVLQAAEGIITTLSVGVGGDFETWDALLLATGTMLGSYLVINVLSTADITPSIGGNTAILFNTFQYVEINMGGFGFNIVGGGSTILSFQSNLIAINGTLEAGTNQVAITNLTNPNFSPGSGTTINAGGVYLNKTNWSGLGGILEVNSNLNFLDNVIIDTSLIVNGMLAANSPSRIAILTVSEPASILADAKIGTLTASAAMTHIADITSGAKVSIQAADGGGFANYAVKLQSGIMRLGSVTGTLTGDVEPGTEEQIGTSAWYVA